jgi:hypothetical protein
LSSDTITLSKNSTYTVSNISKNVDLLARFEIISATINQTEPICKIYPALVHDQLFIEASFADFTVQISDLFGRSVLTLKDCKSVNLQHIKPGMYVVQVKFNQRQLFSTRIIKL